jgi:prophage regulatory protein
MDTEYFDSLDLEELTGTPASTWRYWASLSPPQGPPSFKLGRRRVWRRTAAMAWLAEQEQHASA